jgi:hypothetical protein
MRRIVSKEDEARRKKRNQIILGVALAVIMILSTISFAIQGQGTDDGGSGNTEEKEYNSFTFTNQNGLWVLGSFAFSYLPQEVENISFDVKSANDYQTQPAYIYSENSDAEAEVGINMGLIAQRVQKACLEKTNCSADIPTKTCSDNFIIIKENINKSITREDNCIFIQGPQEEIVKVADEFLFKTLGIK